MCWMTGFPARTPEQFADHFWSRVGNGDPNTGCRLWLSGKFKSGYGNVWQNGKTRRAHIVAYELVFGNIPIGFEVCHTCDTPACCNPGHLFLGTRLDNTMDMIGKSRGAFSRGEKNVICKFTDYQVARVRELHSQGVMKRQEIADEIGMSYSQVSRIIHQEQRK